MASLSSLAWIVWDPERIAFTIPIINRPVAWYGLWFILGFVMAYAMLFPIFQKRLQQTRDAATAKKQAQYLLDRLTWFVVGGTIVGARLGHVFFYEWSLYRKNPIEIFAIWKGGLASHGGVVGILIALYFYQRLIRKDFPEFNYLAILDAIVIPSALTGCFIRIGNFWNQEILGTQTLVPWAIVFGDPMDGSAPVPRHPVQLYEAAAYLLCFVFLVYLWRYRNATQFPGRLSGWFFIIMFSARFFLEFFKTSQSDLIDESFVQMGQYLSIPVVLLGMALLRYSYKIKERAWQL